MADVPGPARVRELATQLILHNARVHDGDAADTLSEIAENETYAQDDTGDAQWNALMNAVETTAKTALISVAFPEA
jgi:hypothetical protein